MAHNKLLVLTSEKQSNSRFNIEFLDRINVESEDVVDDNGNVKKIASYTIGVDSAYIPNFISNIHSRLENNTVSLLADGDNYNLTIPNGLYNIEQLNEWLIGVLDENVLYENPSSSNGYEKTYPIEIFKVQATGKTVILINELYNDTKITLNNNLSKMLGFSTNEFEQGKHTSNEPSNMNTMRPVNIHIDIVSNSRKNEMYSDIAGTFCPSRYYGEMMNIKFTDRVYLPININKITRIGVRLSFIDNTEIIFDRQDIPCIIILHIQRTSV